MGRNSSCVVAQELVQQNRGGSLSTTEFKDPEEPLDRYLGANHVLVQDDQGGNVIVQMKGYIDNVVTRFVKEWK
eukprot:6368415-Amphidinium_carterae.1